MLRLWLIRLLLIESNLQKEAVGNTGSHFLRPFQELTRAANHKLSRRMFRGMQDGVRHGFRIVERRDAGWPHAELCSRLLEEGCVDACRQNFGNADRDIFFFQLQPKRVEHTRYPVLRRCVSALERKGASRLH